MDKLDRIEQAIADLRVEVAELPLQILEKTDARYAPAGRFEWMEKSFYGALLTFLVGVIGWVFKNFA